jgi:predicted amidohydrolase YtcJ
MAAAFARPALVVALALTWNARLAAQRPAPDLVLLGGKVFTADPRRPWAEAIAVRGDRIVAVGTVTEVELLAGARTRRIALDGRTVVPGFDDAHGHAGPAGIRGTLVTVDPSPTPDPPLAALLDSIAAAARRTPAGTWLRSGIGGRVFDDLRATRATLDSVAPEHPVWLAGWSGHGAVINTAALRAARLLDAPDPPGGWLARDARGAPTGRVDEYAIFNTERRLAVARGDVLLARSLRAYAESGLRLGITSVQDMATQYDLDAVRAAARRGDTTRVRHRVIRLPNTDTPGGWRADWRVRGADTALAPRMHVSGVKWILDGTPIERLALMRRPYADRPGWHGRMNFRSTRCARSCATPSSATRSRCCTHWATARSRSCSRPCAPRRRTARGAACGHGWSTPTASDATSWPTRARSASWSCRTPRTLPSPR